MNDAFNFGNVIVLLKTAFFRSAQQLAMDAPLTQGILLDFIAIQL